MNNLPRGFGWQVLEGVAIQYYVAAADFVHSDFLACRYCAREAMNGEPAALAAFILCAEDTQLLLCLKGVSDGK